MEVILVGQLIFDDIRANMRSYVILDKNNE